MCPFELVGAGIPGRGRNNKESRGGALGWKARTPWKNRASEAVALMRVYEVKVAVSDVFLNI